MIIGYFQFDPHNPGQRDLLEQEMRSHGADEVYGEVLDENTQFKQVVKKIGSRDCLLIKDINHVGTLTNFRKVHERLSKKNAEIELISEDTTVEEALKLAEIQHTNFSNRIKAGYRKKKKEGAAWGNIAFGYTVDDEKRFTPNPEEWKIARFIVDKYLELGNLRKTIKAIHDEYGLEWSVTGLRSWLLNPTLRGHTRYKQTGNDDIDIRHNTHQPLITPEESQKIQDTLEKGRKKWGVNSRKHSMGEPYPLKGLLYCACCGSSMFRHRTNVSASGGGVEKVRCRKRDEAKHLCENKKSATLELVEEEVIDALVEKAKTIQTLLKESRQGILHPEPEKVKILRQQIDMLQDVEALRPHQVITEAINRLEYEIEEEHKKLAYEFETKKDVLNVFSNIQLTNKNYWYFLKEEKRIEVFESIIKRVEIKDGKLYDLILKI